jgi:hypothetical protein
LNFSLYVTFKFKEYGLPMKDRLYRIARLQQRLLGILLLAMVYFLAVGPSSLALKLARIAGLNSRPRSGWRPLPEQKFNVSDLKEQS